MKLSEFKRTLQIGQKYKLIKAETLADDGTATGEITHKYKNIHREIKEIKTLEIGFSVPDSERTSYVPYPPASGFTKTDKGFIFTNGNMRLTYEAV